MVFMTFPIGRASMADLPFSGASGPLFPRERIISTKRSPGEWSKGDDRSVGSNRLDR